MRFIALVKKELPEVLLWIVAAGVIVLSVGGWMTYQQMDQLQNHGSHNAFGTGPRLGGRILRHSSPVRDLPWLLLGGSVLLGMIIAVRQFQMPTLLRTWAFTLHRSVGRHTVLLAKAAVALIGLVLGVGVPWTILYVYAVHRVDLGFLTSPRVYIEGWALILTGLLAYLAVALVSISTVRWYTTRLCPLVAAYLMGAAALMLGPLGATFAVLLAAITLLGIQVLHMFPTRDF